MDKSIALEVRLQVETEHMTIDSIVENRSDEVVYLVNRLTRYEKDKGWIPDPTVTYAFVRSERELEFCKRVPPMPTGRIVQPRSYYVTPLPPGESLAETVRMDLPLREHRPFDYHIGEELPVAEGPWTARYVLGYFPAHPLLLAEEVKVHGVEAWRLRSDREAASTSSDAPPMPREILLASEPTQLSVPVIPLP